MTQKERLDIILDIIDKNGFATVKYLTERLQYSTATVNRDLNLLESQNLIKRSYGGASPVETKTTSLVFRYSKMRPTKNRIAKRAVEFIKDGDTVFIDCSTTAQYMGSYLTNKKDITVITNNITLASYLSEWGIRAVCLGGVIMEAPSMVYSAETVENARRYGADKLFFSPGAVTYDGKIGASLYDEHVLLIKTMMENSREIYMLCDHQKLADSCKRYLGDFKNINAVISDFSFSDEVKERYGGVTYVEIEREI